MKVLIIEDEAHAAKLLIAALKELRPDVEVLAELDSVKSSLNWIYKSVTPPDLIFMDIELADGSSFEIFKYAKPPAPVIFTTAYDGYALDAFKVNALDYLVKPIDKKALAEAIQRGEGREKWKLGTLQSQLEEMAGSFRHQTKNRCLVKKGGVFEFINVKDIALAYSEDSVTFLLTYDNKRHIYSRSIEQLFTEIDQRIFYQVNRAQVVNIENIIQVHPYLGQRLKLSLRTSGSLDEVLVSRHRAPEFKQWLDS